MQKYVYMIILVGFWCRHKTGINSYSKLTAYVLAIWPHHCSNIYVVSVTASEQICAGGSYME